MKGGNRRKRRSRQSSLDDLYITLDRERFKRWPSADLVERRGDRWVILSKAYWDTKLQMLCRVEVDGTEYMPTMHELRERLRRKSRKGELFG